MNKTSATSSWTEKCQAVVDCMLLSWSDIEEGVYGFRGYDNLYKKLDSLTPEEELDVACAIQDRRLDVVA